MSSTPATLDSFSTGASRAAADLYLDLLARVLTRTISVEQLVPAMTPVTPWRRVIFRTLSSALGRNGVVLAKPTSMDERAVGRDWPTDAETMVGLARLDNVKRCVVDVLESNVPGDLLEAGVWRGGASIFMRAILEAYGDETRDVWLADSFQGLPKPNPDDYPADATDMHYVHPMLAVSLDDVKANFERYGLLDDRVRFLEGWFQDTLANAPVDRLAVLRLDGDMYESTWVTLEALYDKVSVGGYLIVDDYGLDQCRAAVDDFRRERGITDPIQTVDWTGVFWQRTA